MNRRIEVILTIISILLACITLLFGDNLFQQITGRSFFPIEMPVAPISSDTNTPIPTNIPFEPFSTVTISPIVLNGTWAGEWKNPAGYLYACEITLKIGPSNSIDGYIIWTLKKSSSGSDQSKTGLTAIEYISGTYDPQTRLSIFRGYEKDDPNTVISLDDYKLFLSVDGNTLSGETANHGDWKGILIATRKPQ